VVLAAAVVAARAADHTALAALSRPGPTDHVARALALIKSFAGVACRAGSLRLAASYQPREYDYLAARWPALRRFLDATPLPLATPPGARLPRARALRR
jgi:hypothetical protein